MNKQTLQQMIDNDPYGLLDEPNPSLYQALKDWLDFQLADYKDKDIDNAYFAYVRTYRQLDFLNDVLGGNNE